MYIPHLSLPKPNNDRTNPEYFAPKLALTVFYFFFNYSVQMGLLLGVEEHRTRHQNGMSNYLMHSKFLH